MEEILQQILSRLDTIDNRLGALEQGQAKLEQGQAKLEQGQASLQQQVTDLRDSTFKEFQGMHKELGAIRETQSIALDKWTESINIQKRVERLLDERAIEL